MSLRQTYLQYVKKYSRKFYFHNCLMGIDFQKYVKANIVENIEHELNMKLTFNKMSRQFVINIIYIMKLILGVSSECSHELMAY